MISVTQNKVNLCSSCKHSYPSCPAKVADVLYGDGTGCDNICCCAYYKPKCDTEESYQRGLDDAWEAARKVGHCKLWDDYTKDTGKPSVCAVAVLDHYTAYEAIAKLKAYEEKQQTDDEIKVGDEVNWLGDCFIVTRIFQLRNMKEQCDGIDDDGCVYANVLIDDLEKTGRHFDIKSILEEMRND